MTRKDKVDADILIALNNLDYTYQWNRAVSHGDINDILSTASKSGSGFTGYPDQIYLNEDKQLLILVEDKSNPADHESETGETNNPEKYAVDGILWYLKKFINKKFSNWKIVGIAVSGDINDSYNHLISTYIIVDGKIENVEQVNSLCSEEEYLQLFVKVNEEEMIERISTSSKKINNMLRNIDSQKRPILLSALMIALFEIDRSSNSFINEFESNSGSEIIAKLPARVREVLRSESIPEEKLNIILNQITFLDSQIDLKSNNVLRDILFELKYNVIPYFEIESNYDIMGSFYAEFLRYAGIANVKNGIVLTPAHITELFTELIPLKPDDILFDPASGSGAFLIAGMNALIKKINNSDLPNKQNRIKNVKEKQLVGFEINPTMYTLSVSNMLFRHDGKSQLYNLDSFSEEAEQTLKRLDYEGIRPTIGFVNPPYGGRENKSNPTKKELTFLKLLLDNCSRYVVMIAPLSTYFKDQKDRDAILKQHRLKCVINMPEDLFQPNAATITAVSVFEVGQPQGEYKTKFIDLPDDGFVLAKNKGRTDLFNKWDDIKEGLLDKLEDIRKYENAIDILSHEVKSGDEWLLQSFAKTDYSNLGEESFERAIREQLVFEARKNLGLLNKDIDEIELLSIVSDYYGEQENGSDDDEI